MTKAIFNIRTNKEQRVRDRLDAKIRQSVAQKQPLFCIGHLLPDITIGGKSFIEPVSNCADIAQALRLLEEVNDKKVKIDGLSAKLHPYSQNLFESKKLDRNEHVL
jgi:hypothetical protein